MPGIALVAGGTGLVGGHLVKYLVESNNFSEVVVLVRDQSTFHIHNVTTVKVDYDQLERYKSSLKADCIFCCLGTTIKKAGSKENFKKVDYTYPNNLAKIALKNSCKQFNIVTASGSNPKSMFFYNRVKGDIENTLISLDYENLNIFRPSLLLGDRNEKRLGEDISEAVLKILNPVLIGRFKKFSAIQAKTVAKAMLDVSLENNQGVRIYESDEIQGHAKI